MDPEALGSGVLEAYGRPRKRNPPLVNCKTDAQRARGKGHSAEVG